MSDAFRHVESARTIVFGSGALDESGDLIGESYTLLTTQRAAATAPAVLVRATSVVEVPSGHVDALAAQLRAAVVGRRLVALGGGRVIDVAKALAAADPPREVVAIPTSLSGAEMTRVHRHAQGVAPDTPRVRPAVVINDPALSASQPVDSLAASTSNALGHSVTAMFSDRATPISRSVGRDAIQRLVCGWSGTEPDRAAIALGALLAGWSVDHSGLGPHHALAQTAVRTASLSHAQTNAALLPATVRAIRSRQPAELEALDATLGVALESVAEQLRERAGAGLGALASDDELLERTVEAAAKRPELDLIPPAPDRAEIREVYRASAGV
jgi:maleylacetate reductase